MNNNNHNYDYFIHTNEDNVNYINNTFVGHPLIENNKDNKKIIENIIPKDKKIISIFPGSRKSETDVLLNILIDFIKLMNKRHNDFYFHQLRGSKNKNLYVFCSLIL